MSSDGNTALGLEDTASAMNKEFDLENIGKEVEEMQGWWSKKSRTAESEK